MIFQRLFEALIPQVSIPGPFLFDIFMYDMFLILNTTYFTGYADENLPFVVRDNIAHVIKALEKIGKKPCELILK